MTRLRELSLQESVWLMEAMILLPVAALSIRLSGWSSTLTRIGRWIQRDLRTEAQGYDPALVARVVRIAATYGPYRATCLPRSVALWALLRRDGFTPVVTIGVRKGPRGVEAHAWVEVAGVTLDETSEATPFVPLRRPADVSLS